MNMDLEEEEKTIKEKYDQYGKQKKNVLVYGIYKKVGINRFINQRGEFQLSIPKHTLDWEADFKREIVMERQWLQRELFYTK